MKRDPEQGKTVDIRDFKPVEVESYNREELEQAVENTNALLFNHQDTHFEFKVHEGTGRVMVNLIDNKTDEVVKEIPPEKILDLVANIWELAGIIVDERG
ncbi:MAG TPA: hypothetical protein DHN33_03500 [Eubacteriaceae bacterium]|nr:hypothetical protein [Eubacteriaceae bacterium]